MMQNFFTPVQVIRKHPLCYSNEELRRFNESLLFQITPPLVPSLADERKNVIHWLRSLPIAHRQQAAAIHSPQLAALARRLYQDSSLFDSMRYGFQLSSGQFRVIRERYYKQSRQREKALLQEVRLVSQGQLFEALTLAESALVDPDALFEKFQQVLGGVLLDGNHFNEEELSAGRVSFEAEVLGSQPKTLGVWICQLLLKQILLSFRTGPEKIAQVCRHIKQQEQEYCKLWRELSPQQRLQLVEKGFSRPHEQLMAEYRNVICVAVADLPRLYIPQPIEEAKQAYIELNPKDIFQHLVFSTLEQSLNLYEIFKIEIAMEIEAYLTGLKTGALKKPKKKKKKNANERNDKIPATPQILQQRSSQPSVKSEQLLHKVELQTQLIAQNESFPVSHPQQLATSDYVIRQPDLTASHEENQVSPESQPKVLQSSSLLDTFTRRIKEKNNDRHRKIILNRITFLLAQLNLTCKPFGSYAVRLSLPDSDLDIQVDSSLLGYFYLDYLPQRKQLITSLEFLRKVLEPHQWTSGFELFYNARIPLLTFKADAGIHFLNQTNQKTKLKLNGKAVPAGQGVIQVDLSIQPYANMSELPHNGLQATDLIREWLQTLPILQKLVLGLKSIVKRANLHKSYEGGLSSYCLVLLAVAFLKHNYPTETHLDSIFQALVAFIRRFHKERLVIDVVGEELVRKGDGEGPILVSPWDGRNLVERAFRFQDILDALERWKEVVEK